MPDIQDYPQIYSAAGTRLAVLDKAYDVITTDQIITDTNGASTLNFNLPLDDPKQNLFDIEDEVHVAGDIFIIRTIQPGWDSGTLVTQVYAEAKWYDIAGFDPIQPMTMTGATAISVMEALLQSTDWSPGVVDVTTVADFSLTQVTNPLAAIMGMPAVFGGELEFDDSNKAVSLRQQIGGDNGLFYAFGKNLQSNQRTVDSRNLYTRMRPYGAQDSNNNPLTIASANNGVDYIENYSWYDQTGKPRKIKCYEQTNDKIIDPTALKTWGQAILAQLCMPKITYTMQVVIDKNQGIPQIGDTVRVYDPVLKMTTTNRVAKRNYNVLQPWLTTVQLSTALYTSSDQTTAIANDVAVQMSQQKSFFQVAVDQATKDITGASGGYVRLNPSKNPSEIIIMDTPDINTATKVWRWNSGGLGYSKNGYNGPYELAMTQSGQIVADFITTGVLRAIDIEGVTVTGSTVNGTTINGGNINGAALHINNNGMDIWLNQDGFHVQKGDFNIWANANGLSADKAGTTLFYIGQDGNAEFNGTVRTHDGNGNASSRLWAQGLEFYKDNTFLASLGRIFGLDGSGTQGVGLEIQDGNYLSIGYKSGSNYLDAMRFTKTAISSYLKFWMHNDLQLSGHSVSLDADGGNTNHIYESSDKFLTHEFATGLRFVESTSGNLTTMLEATRDRNNQPTIDTWADLDMHGWYLKNANIQDASLAELKQDIKPYDDYALDVIKKVKIYRFRFKKEATDGTDHEKYGPIIGDGYGGVPNEISSPDKKGVDPYNERHLMMKAIQELSDKVGRLEKRVAELESNYSSHKKM